MADGEENYLDLKAPTNDVYTEVGLAVGSDEYLTLRDASATTTPARTQSIAKKSEFDDDEEQYLAVAAPKFAGKASTQAKITAGTLKRERGNKNVEERERLTKWLSLPTEILNRETAAATMAGQPEGTFIFRRGSEMNTYAITAVTDGQLKNYKVQREEILDGTEFLVARDDRLPGSKKRYLSIYQLLEDKDIRKVWKLSSMCKVFDTQATNHYRCREETYPNSNVNRAFVPDGLVPWTKPYDAYKPTPYTEQSDAKADAELSLVPPTPGMKRSSSSSKFKFNKMDGKIDRRSLIGAYDMLGDLPLNPKGRTGVTGRGSLLRWGPNLSSTIILTRMMKQMTGNNFMLRRGKPVVEFLAVENALSGEISFVTEPYVHGELVSSAFEKQFTSDDAIKRNFVGTDKEKKAFKKGIQELFKKPTKLFQGYVDDPRNTDNAWVESTVAHIHDPTGEFFDLFLFADDDDSRLWMPADKRVQLQPEHSAYLQQISDKLGASYF